MNKHTILKDDLLHSGDDAPESGHDAWVKEKIEAALQKKKAGYATYKPLRDVAAKYDLDAS